MKLVVKNGALLAPEPLPRGFGLVLDHGRIEGVCAGEALETAAKSVDRVIDATGLFVSPGFVDIHLHGGGGFDFMDGTAAAYLGAAAFHARHGTTSLVPTTLSGEDGELTMSLDAFVEAKRQNAHGAELLGLHLEGPYFAMEQRGAQDPAYIKNPTSAHYLPILDRYQDILRWSAAPELDGALAFGDELTRRGILPAIGHSDAFYEDVVAAERHGFSHVTHLYSGMSSLRRVNAYRRLGVVESAFLMDELTVEMIADGKHLPPELLRLIVKCKPIGQISLITDCIRCAGVTDESELLIGSRAHGQPVVVEDGVAKMPDRSCFAGSVCTTDRCVRTMTQLAGVSLSDAVRMMTQSPAERMSVSSRKGMLKAGMDADVCIFDENIDMQYVVCRGEVILDAHD